MTQQQYEDYLARGVSQAERHAITSQFIKPIGKTDRKKPPTEDQEQAALVAWLRQRGIRFHATPNGGFRSKATAGRMKLTGTVSGVPDLCIWPPIGSTLPVVWVELKRQRTGQISKPQRDWLDYLEALKTDGHKIVATVCYGCTDAIKFLTEQGY